MKNSKILIKFPTRERPEKFFHYLDKYYHLMVSDNYKFIISCDTDDTTMNNTTVKKKLKSYRNLEVFFNNNKSKIEAINNDLKNQDFDILLLASDDMEPVIQGYDVLIKNIFINFFPDYDGVLWQNDGFQKNNLNTLCILGKKYYDRFNYIYHPSYKSLYCDTEFTMVSMKLNKAKYIDMQLILHKQYSIIKEEPDKLYLRNDNLKNIDEQNFNIRYQKNFPL